MMLPLYEFLVIGLILTFVALLFTGLPVAWCLAGASLTFTFIALAGARWLEWDTYFLTDMRIFGVFVQRIYGQMSNWVMVALPMFIFMGLMLERSGVTERLMSNFVQLFGRFRGGLGICVVLIGVLLAASTGIVGASVVLLSLLSLPAMMQLGYNRSFAAGIVSATGTLGIIIPPSIMLIIMADQISIPVGNLFMGALLPGLMLGGLYLVYVVVMAAIYKDIAPAPKDLKPITWPLVRETLRSVVPPFVLILAVLGTIFFGIATPTESSALGVVGASILAAANGKLSLQVVKEVGIATTKTTAFIAGIFMAATIFAVVMRQLGGDEFIKDSLMALPLGPTGIVIFILGVVFVAGFFLDWLEISLIILPLVAPVISQMGFDMTWFVILFALTLQTSFITPPVGFSIFYLKGVAPREITTIDVYKGVIPFVLLQILAVAICFLAPALITWLPAALY